VIRLQPQLLRQAFYIIVIATALGLVVNQFHPHKVVVTTKRPALNFAPDTGRAQNLPVVTIAGNEVEDSAPQEAELVFVTTAQLKQLLNNGLVLLLDTRDSTAFEIAHIPGALNLPAGAMPQHCEQLDSLAGNSWLVCYCDGPPCDLAEQVARQLIARGYPLVAVYFEGLQGWTRAGYETARREGFRDER